MAISKVQSNSNSQGAALTVSVTLGTGITQGNLVVVTLTSTGANPTLSAPAGWNQAGTTEGVVSVGSAAIFYLVVGAGQAGQTSWTFTSSLSVAMQYGVEEWNATNGWPASPVDQTAQANGNSTTPASGATATTAQAEELWIGVVGLHDTIQTPSSVLSGFTVDSQKQSGGSSGTVCYMLSEVASATSTPNAGFTVATARAWGAICATFMDNAAGGSVNGSSTIFAFAGLPGGINAGAALGGGINANAALGGGIGGVGAAGPGPFGAQGEIQASSSASTPATLEGQAGISSGLSGQGQVQAGSAATPSLTLTGFAGFISGLAGQALLSAAGSLGGAIHGIATALAQAAFLGGLSGSGTVYGSTASLNQATVEGQAGFGGGQSGSGSASGAPSASTPATFTGSGNLAGGLFAALARITASGGTIVFLPFRLAISAVQNLLNLLFFRSSALSLAFSENPLLSLVFSAASALRLSFAENAALSLVFQMEPPVAQPNSTIQVTATLTDINGNPVTNAATCNVTVTFPDGSTSSFSLGSGVTNAGSGKYVLTYNTKGPGQHLEDWKATDSSGNETEYHNITPASF